jgi:hypothetical protein
MACDDYQRLKAACCAGFGLKDEIWERFEIGDGR